MVSRLSQAVWGLEDREGWCAPSAESEHLGWGWWQGPSAELTFSCHTQRLPSVGP